MNPWMEPVDGTSEWNPYMESLKETMDWPCLKALGRAMPKDVFLKMFLKMVS